MPTDTIHITIRDDMSEELHLAAEEGMPKYVGASASVSRIENGVKITMSDYKGETEEVVYEAIENIEFNDGIMTITLPDGRTFTSEDLTGPQGPQGIQGIQGEKGDSGEAGPQGIQGIQGDKGDKGDTGAKGDKGDKGDKGEQGETGPSGADGTDGEDGFSPSASVSKVGSTATITITDKDGTTTASISDGSIADEQDPVFTASPAYGIASADIAAWNNKSDFSGDYDDLENKPSIPSKTSDLTNDSGFIDSSALPTALSDLTNDMDVSDFPNDAGYLTSFTETDPTVPSWAKEASKPSYTASEISGLIDFFRPVGSYYETSDEDFDPNIEWGGTWILETEGQVHVSAGTNYTVSGALSNQSDGGSPYIQEHQHGFTQPTISITTDASINDKTGLTTKTDGYIANGVPSSGDHHHTIGYEIVQRASGTGNTRYPKTGTNINTSTDGAHTHDLPNHSHVVNDHKHTMNQAAYEATNGAVGNINTVGLSTGTSGNMQPHINVYRWHRTA